jgi:arsenate reductase (glutaredoxin)
MPVTIYHNPKCSTSHKVLETLKARGAKPRIVEYLKDPPDRKTLQALLKAMRMEPRDLLRRRGTPYDELDLDNPGLSRERLIDAMLQHPILIERPIVVTDKGTRLCRPPERLEEIL